MKCYLSDEAVRGGVRGGASVRALKPALPLGVLSLRTARSEVQGRGRGGREGCGRERERRHRESLIALLHDNLS